MLTAAKWPDRFACNARHRGPARPGERRLAAVLFAALVTLRLFYIVRYRFDSDESQHLHIAWSVAQGLLQYRDVFDNHTPLFGLIFSPLAWFVGERPELLFVARLAMVPLWLMTLWGAAYMGDALFSPRAGIWTPVLLGAYPYFFFPSVEFRTDNLWTPLWVWAVVLLVTGALSPWRAFFSGLLVGACFMVSMKTVLLLAAIAMSAGITLVLVPCRAGWRSQIARLAAFAAGIIPIPFAMVSWFVAHGAGSSMFYNTVAHNILPGVDASNNSPAWMLVFPAALPLLYIGARWIVSSSPETAMARGRCVVFLFAFGYRAALVSFWTLITRQDYLPYYPFFFVVFTPVLLAVAGAALRPLAAPAVIAAIEIAWALLGRPPWINGTAKEINLVREASRLTEPGQPIMDYKGETLFRRRPFYYAIEPFTVVRIKRGIIPPQSIASRILETGTVVAVPDNPSIRLPRAPAAFIARNFISVGQLSVAGKILQTAPGNEAQPFKLTIPTRYTLVNEHGKFAGLLDGIPFTGPRHLAPGTHTIVRTAGTGRLALVWSRAVERGFSPWLHSGSR